MLILSLLSYKSLKLCSFLCTFSCFVFLSFRWDDLYCSIFELVDLFCLHFAFESSHWVLNFGYWIFQFKIFHLVLYVFCFFSDTFSFVSNMFIIVHWSIFMIITVKSLSDNSSIYVISVLVSVICLFPFELRWSWFVVRGVIFSCSLYILAVVLRDSDFYFNLVTCYCQTR